MYGASYWLDISILHREYARAFCPLPVFEDEVERRILIIATDSYEWVFKVINWWETELISELCRVSILWLRVYTTPRR